MRDWPGGGAPFHPGPAIPPAPPRLRLIAVELAPRATIVASSPFGRLVPAFGRSLLAHWWLDPDITYLNHGTVGATPRLVLDAQHVWQRRVEAQPASFLFREL